MMGSAGFLVFPADWPRISSSSRPGEWGSPPRDGGAATPRYTGRPNRPGSPDGSGTRETEVKTIDTFDLGTPEAAVRSCVNLFSRLFEVPEDYVACYLDMYYQLRLRMEGTAAGGEDSSSALRAPSPQGEGKTEADGGTATDDGAAEKGRSVKRRSASYANTAARDAAVFKRAVRERFLTARQDGLATPQILEAAEGRITEADVWKIIQGHNVAVDVYRELDRVLAALRPDL